MQWSGPLVYTACPMIRNDTRMRNVAESDKLFVPQRPRNAVCVESRIRSIIVNTYYLNIITKIWTSKGVVMIIMGIGDGIREVG